ncbi:CHAD domain-containing protein [Thiomicrorhabdus sp.]|uniref:CHAD domain-containing protein n=1 Tax=Thiomicrorhabdus sp. TaxID=2039724 RepID=UPI002AA734F0|nr:CHAD domain-containing protein [Thiomicrorhabdus sp.]
MKTHLEKLNHILTRYIELPDDDSKQVKVLHDLRVSARKLITLINPNETLTASLKKLIQSSNKIRDLDVFINETLPIFPKKLQADLKEVHLTLHNTRADMNHEFKSLLSDELIGDLNQTHTPSTKQEIKADLSRHQMPLNDIDKRLKKVVRELQLLDLEDKQLHKIRLVTKRLHYQLERFYPEEKKSIALAKLIQTQLGKFHDIYQAIKLVKHNKPLLKPKTYKSCIDFLKDKKMQSIRELRKDIRKK